MAISYIADDPAVAGARAQPIGPSPDHPASGVTFAISNLLAEQISRRPLWSNDEM